MAVGPVGRAVPAAVTLAGYSLTGAATNPARWFGTVIWENSLPSLQSGNPFRDSPVYWIGPILGAILAGGGDIMLILPPETEHHPGGHVDRNDNGQGCGRLHSLSRQNK